MLSTFFTSLFVLCVFAMGYYLGQQVNRTRRLRVRLAPIKIQNKSSNSLKSKYQHYMELAGWL